MMSSKTSNKQKKLLAQSLQDENVKHDIAAIASHKTKQCGKFSFNTTSATSVMGSFQDVCPGFPIVLKSGRG